MDIHNIILTGDINGVCEWLKKNFDINRTNSDGYTPINSASFHGHTEIIKLLLTQPGIDFNQPDNNGWTPIYSASLNGHTEIVKLLLAQLGIDFNQPDNYGWTPINRASHHGYTEIIKILEEYEQKPIKM